MRFRASGPKMYDSEMLRGCSVIRNNISERNLNATWLNLRLFT